MPDNPTPHDLARETLKLLAARRIPPTPDNYRRIYLDITGRGEELATDQFPTHMIDALLAAVPRSTPSQVNLARQLDRAAKTRSWDDLQTALIDFANQEGTNHLPWGELIADLLQQWETLHADMSPARKREAIGHLLESTASNPNILFARLSNLVRSWSQVERKLAPPTADRQPDQDNLEEAPAPPSGNSAVTSQWQTLLACTFESVIAAELDDAPQFAREARDLGRLARHAETPLEAEDVAAKIDKFRDRMKLISDDRAEIRSGLTRLLALLVANVGNLVDDDRWLHGQLKMLEDVVRQPLTPRAISDAESRFGELLVRQSQVKRSLDEAKAALRSMLASFVDSLADFAVSTSDYHDKIVLCARKISAANDIAQLSGVISEVIQETRAIQACTERSRGELIETRERVESAERRILELQDELDRTSALMRHDQLTGTLNRRGLDELYDKEVGRALRRQSPLCLAMLDIDNFKALNDAFGHNAGDSALIHLTSVLRENLRPQDALARYGGEEFLILLPDTNVEESNGVLVRLQRELTRRFFLHDNQKILITFSAGVTLCRKDEPLPAAIKRADQAMYEAKRQGKNRVLKA